MKPRHAIFVFKCGDDYIQYCSDYKYLGLVLNEFLNYNITAKSVALSVNRALGLLIVKCKILGGVPHGVFTKLFDSMVSSIVEYGAIICGTRNYSCINAMQNRACRFLLGVGKYTPNNAVSGDMDWKLIFRKQWKAVINLWCRLNNVSSDRVHRKVFVWADCVVCVRVKLRTKLMFYLGAPFIVLLEIIYLILLVLLMEIFVF